LTSAVRTRRRKAAVIYPKLWDIRLPLDFSTIDFRKRPGLYRIGKGEQGVLLLDPTKVRYCLTGNSKRLVKLATQPGESIRCFLAIEPKTTSLEWTWLANFSRWVTRGHEGTPIISQAVSTPRALESYCLTKRTTTKHNRLRCFIRNGRRSERIRSIYN
jgi:hypothetical protein